MENQKTISGITGFLLQHYKFRAAFVLHFFSVFFVGQ